MKLNKFQKDAIVAAIFQDVPTPNLPAIANLMTTMMQLGWKQKQTTV